MPIDEVLIKEQGEVFVRAQGNVFVTCAAETDPDTARTAFEQKGFTADPETARALHVTGDYGDENVAVFKSVLRDHPAQSVTPAPADRARVAGQDPR
jgi:hypothetical protein